MAFNKSQVVTWSLQCVRTPELFPCTASSNLRGGGRRGGTKDQRKCYSPHKRLLAAAQDKRPPACISLAKNQNQKQAGSFLRSKRIPVAFSERGAELERALPFMHSPQKARSVRCQKQDTGPQSNDSELGLCPTFSPKKKVQPNKTAKSTSSPLLPPWQSLLPKKRRSGILCLPPEPLGTVVSRSFENKGGNAHLLNPKFSLTQGEKKQNPKPETTSNSAASYTITTFAKYLLSAPGAVQMFAILPG